MAATTSLIQDLWRLADADAGYLGDSVALIVVRDFGGPGSQGRFMPPGERSMDEPSDVQRRIQAAVSRSRIVLPVNGLEDDPAAVLGLMRHHLQYARIYQEARGTYALALDVAASLYPLFHDAGRGTGLIYNAVPMMRSANAAAAWLVTQTFGPQVERFRDPRFATLFRPDEPPSTLAETTRQTVVFGAVWADALDAHLGGDASRLRALLAGAHKSAPEWWNVLLGDPAFARLAEPPTTYAPLPEEREAFAGYPADAWRPLIALIDRAIRYGTTLI